MTQELTPQKQRAFRLIGLLLLILFTCGTMELMARFYIGLTGQDINTLKPIVGPNRVGRVEPHPFAPLVLSPDTEFDMLINYPLAEESVAWHYTTNEAGFRGESTPQAKPPGTYRILVLGGSAAFGDGVDDDQTWAEQLERLLQVEHPAWTIEVLNFGLPTATSAHSLSLLALRGIYYQPDMVIFYEGGNDIHCCLGYNNFRTDYSHRLKDFEGLSPWLISLPTPFYRSYALTVANHAWNQQVGSDTGIVEVQEQELADDPLLGLEAVLGNIRSMRAIAEANGAIFILSTYHWFEPAPREQRYNDALRQLATQEQMALVDQATLIRAGDLAIHLDNVHFTEYGNQLMAENYFEYLQLTALGPPE